MRSLLRIVQERTVWTIGSRSRQTLDDSQQIQTLASSATTLIFRTMLRGNCRASRPALRGVSLLETAVATLLVSITLVVSLNTLAFVTQTTLRDAEAQRSTQIAQVLLSEISSKPFADSVNATTALGRESGEPATRAAWDDCDDYKSWSTTAIATVAGQSLGGATGWQAQVDVVYCDPSNPNATVTGPTQLKRINLALTSPSGRSFTYTTLRCANGVLLTAQATGTNVLTSVDISLQGAGAPSTTNTRFHNQQEPN